MLSFRRVVRVPELGAAREVHFLLHSEVRAYVVRTRGVAVEKRLFAGTALARAPVARRLVQIVLAGRMRLGDGARTEWLEAGDVSLQPHGLADERWEGEPFEAAVVEWLPARGGAVHAWQLGRLAARDRARVTAWAQLAAGDALVPARAAVHAATLLDVLRAAGLPVPDATPAALVERVPTVARELASALGASLSALHARPMLVDLERALGRSARHLRRGLAAFDHYYCFPGGPSWQRQLHAWRLSLAATLMTAPGARTEQVAAALGYGSPRAFCAALAQAGLPSPGRIAHAAAHVR